MSAVGYQSRLDPASHVLTERFDEAIGRFVGKSFGDIENCLDEALNIVPNNWDIVAARLKQRNIL